MEPSTAVPPPSTPPPNSNPKKKKKKKKKEEQEIDILGDDTPEPPTPKRVRCLAPEPHSPSNTVKVEVEVRPGNTKELSGVNILSLIAEVSNRDVADDVADKLRQMNINIDTESFVHADELEAFHETLQNQLSKSTNNELNEPTSREPKEKYDSAEEYEEPSDDEDYRKWKKEALEGEYDDQAKVSMPDSKLPVKKFLQVCDRLVISKEEYNKLFKKADPRAVFLPKGGPKADIDNMDWDMCIERLKRVNEKRRNVSNVCIYQINSNLCTVESTFYCCNRTFGFYSGENVATSQGLGESYIGIQCSCRILWNQASHSGQISCLCKVFARLPSFQAC